MSENGERGSTSGQLGFPLAELVQGAEEKRGCLPLRSDSCGKEGLAQLQLRLRFYFGTVYVLQNIIRERSSSFLVSLETSVAALLRASKLFLRLHNCRNSDLLHASKFDASPLVLTGSAELVLTDSSFNVWQLKIPRTPRATICLSETRKTPSSS